MLFCLWRFICLYSVPKMISILKKEQTHYFTNMKSNVKIHNVSIFLPEGKLSKLKTVQPSKGCSIFGAWQCTLISCTILRQSYFCYKTSVPSFMYDWFFWFVLPCACIKEWLSSQGIGNPPYLSLYKYFVYLYKTFTNILQMMQPEMVTSKGREIISFLGNVFQF